MDARRNQVYTSFYLWEGDVLKRQSNYLAVEIGECVHLAKEYNRPVIFLGDGILVYKEIIKEKMRDSEFLIAPQSCSMQKASSIGSLAMILAEEGKAQDPMEFVPFYLRKSQAEREYEAKINQEIHD